MSKARPTPSGASNPQPESEAGLEVAAIPDPASATAAEGVVVLSHEVLFEDASPDQEPCCDACGTPIAPEEGDGEGYGMRGRGVYMWTRGGERRVESAPLCPSCAAAIGMTALARWEIEEEEG